MDSMTTLMSHCRRHSESMHLLARPSPRRYRAVLNCLLRPQPLKPVLVYDHVNLLIC